jgi:hypothetical protein
MRYILTLFLISLVASSEIIDKADEIKEFSEYDDVDLQFFFIPFIVKAVTAGIGLITKAKAIITGTKIFKFVKGAVSVGSKIVKGAKGLIAKGKALITKSKIFQTGKKIFERGKKVYDTFKATIEKSKLYQKGKRFYEQARNIYNKYKNIAEHNKYYKTYKEVKDTYDKVKGTYDQVKNYYDKGRDFFDKYLKKRVDEEEKSPEQIKKEQERQKQAEKSQAFAKYYKIKNDRTLNLTQKQNALNAHLSFMLAKGFITPLQKQNMAKITPSGPARGQPVRRFGGRRL